MLSTLLHTATFVFQTVPLMSWTGKLRVFCPKMQNRSEMDRYVLFRMHALAVTPKMSTQVGSCCFHADSGFLWVRFESICFAELIVLERQVQAILPLPRGQNLPNKYV